MTGIYNSLCLVIIAMFTIVTAEDYCSLKSCTEGSHTMCQYTSSTPAKECGQAWSDYGLSDAEKNNIVNKHNELRQKVASGRETRGNPGPQPAAVTMPDLTWDNELEKIAQRWAIQCNFNHDKCRNTNDYVVGQNIAETYSSDENKSSVENMVQMWYDEVDKFDKNNVDKYIFNTETRHYTQLIWARTEKIGCGRIKYISSDGWYKHYVVCNYSPSGNWQGEKIYEKK